MLWRLKMSKNDNTRIVALIEQAERATPFCDCGRPMAATAENREIWLRCTAHQHAPGGALRRFLATLSSAGHTRELLIERV